MSIQFLKKYVLNGVRDELDEFANVFNVPAQT